MEKKLSIQFGYGFEGEGVFLLPSGARFDSRKYDPEKGIGCSQAAWDAHHAQNPLLIRKQGQKYDNILKDALKKLVVKRKVKLKKGESLEAKETKVEDLITWLKEWEQFKR